MSADAKTTDATRTILIAIGLVAIATILWLITDALLIGFGAIVFATVLRTIAGPLQRRAGWSERWSVVAAVFGLLILAALLCWLFGAQAAHEFAELREQLPVATQKFKAWVERWPAGRTAIETLRQGTGNGEALSNLSTLAGAALGGVGNLLLIVFAGIYFALDPKLYRNGALRLLPPARRPQVGQALDDAGLALRKWLSAQLIVMAVVGTLTGVGLALLGVPLALSLGLLMGLLEFVPLVGPIIASVPGLLLAFAKGPEVALYAALIYIAVQQVESNLITPLVQRWAVELPPVVALLSIVACGLLFGFLGVIFATPIAVVMLALVQHLYVEDTLEHHRPAAKSPARDCARRAR